MKSNVKYHIVHFYDMKIFLKVFESFTCSYVCFNKVNMLNHFNSCDREFFSFITIREYYLYVGSSTINDTCVYIVTASLVFLPTCVKREEFSLVRWTSKLINYKKNLLNSFTCIVSHLLHAQITARFENNCYASM